MKITFNSWDSFCEYLNRTPGIKNFKPIIESKVKLVIAFKPKVSDDITVEFTYV